MSFTSTCSSCLHSAFVYFKVVETAYDVTGLYLVVGYWLSLVKPPYYTPSRKKIVSAL